MNMKQSEEMRIWHIHNPPPAVHELAFSFILAIR